MKTEQNQYKPGPIYVASDNKQMAALAKPGLDRWDVFALISKWSLEVEKAKTKSEGDFLFEQISGIASRVLQEIRRLAFSGNEKAAKTLHAILAEYIYWFDELCHQNPTLFEPIARKRTGWPGLISRMTHVTRANEKLLSKLNLGLDVRLNISGKQPDWDSPEVQAAVSLHGIMEVWRDAQSPERVKETRAVMQKLNKELGRPANYRAPAKPLKWATPKMEEENRLRQESFKLAKYLQPLTRENYKEWFKASWPLFLSRYGKDFENRKCFAEYWKDESFLESVPGDKRRKRLVKGARGWIRDEIKKKTKQAFRSIAPK